MTILQPAFNILTVCGCWRPRSWSSTFQRSLYTFYTICILCLLHSFSLSQLIYIILNVRSADGLSDSFYMFIATVLGCSKIITLLVNYRDVKMLVEKLGNGPWKPMDPDELEIRRKLDKSIGFTTIQYTILVETTVLCMILSSLFTNFRDRELTYRAWLPFDYSSSNLFYFVYIHQIFALTATSLLNVAGDVIVCGLLVHIYAQLEIFRHRLKKITPQTQNELRNCVRYHNFIYRFSLTINEKFRTIIGIQFVSSTLVVCFNLYQLTNTPFSSKYLQFVLYMGCMMLQIFYYCWYGNQLKLKSIEVIYMAFEVDWTNLDKNSKTSLLMIMNRARTPIEFTSALVIVMDLHTFVNILKLSYSTYNLLQRTNES